MSKIDKIFFNYERIARNMWWDKVKEAQELNNIRFDSENDDACSQRKIILKCDEYLKTVKKGDTISFKCELRCAGGDWEWPVYYFCCQVYNHSFISPFYDNLCFVLIPNKEQGNGHLLLEDDNFVSPSSNDDVKLGEEDDCWKSINDMLGEYCKQVIIENDKKYSNCINRVASQFINPNVVLSPYKSINERELTRLLRQSIAAEEEAIHLYESIVDMTDNSFVKDVVQDIANEEKVHVGEFQKVLSIILSNENEFLNSGYDEVISLKNNIEK